MKSFNCKHFYVYKNPYNTTKMNIHTLMEAEYILCRQYHAV